MKQLLAPIAAMTAAIAGDVPPIEESRNRRKHKRHRDPEHTPQMLVSQRRPWRDRNSPYYGMTGKQYRRMENADRRKDRERQTV